MLRSVVLTRCLAAHCARTKLAGRLPGATSHAALGARWKATGKGSPKPKAGATKTKGAANAAAKPTGNAATKHTGNAATKPTANTPSDAAAHGWQELVRRYPVAVPGREREVAYWLLGSAGITAGVMAVGAYVRLNESGLSMLDWRLFGRHLPRDEAAWLREFDRYKGTPEYKQVHYGIDLQEYKHIYFNEWIHRMLGRFSGLCFGGGAVYLGATGALAPGGYAIAVGVSLLGLSQALVGKWMVDSGFKEPETENKTPRVSPYRLAMHFTNALGIYSICLWNGLKLLGPMAAAGKWDVDALRRVKGLGRATLASLLFTMLYGTVVAGNDAGLAYNTWPKMMDSYIPDDYAEVTKIKHLFEKTGVVQFNHRCLGYTTTALAAATMWAARAPGVPVAARKLAMGMMHASLLQVLLGIITVVKHVPLHGAMTHHVNAMALWSLALAVLVRVP